MSSTFKNITIYLLGTVVTFLIFIIFPNIIVLKEDILSLFFSTTAQVFIILLGLWAITFGLMKAFDTRGPETIILSYLNYYKKLSVMINGLEKDKKAFDL